jgi:formate dehydrogenase assembly factor FdhD
VQRIHGSAPVVSDTDLLAVEEPLMLEVEHGPGAARRRSNAGVILRTPVLDEELATGLLFADGFITSAAAIERF